MQRLVEDACGANLDPSQIRSSLKGIRREYTSRCNRLRMFDMYESSLSRDEQSGLALFEVLCEDFMLFSGFLAEEDETSRGSTGARPGTTRQNREIKSNKRKILRLLRKILGVVASSKTDRVKNKELIRNFFWGFAFECLTGGDQLKRLLELMILVRPESMASSTLFHILENTRVESGEEPFMQSWLTQMALSVLVLTRQDVDDIIMGDDQRVFYYQTLETLLREVDAQCEVFHWKWVANFVDGDYAKQTPQFLSLGPFQNSKNEKFEQEQENYQSLYEKNSQPNQFGFNPATREKRPELLHQLELEQDPSVPVKIKYTLEPENHKENAEYICKAIEKQPELAQICKDLRARCIIQRVKSLGLRLSWPELDWELSDESLGPDRMGEEEAQFRDVLNRKILAFFLFGKEPRPDLTEGRRVEVLNYLFEYCGLRKDREEFLKNRFSMDHYISSTEHEDEVDGDKWPAEGVSEPGGVFFEFYKRIREEDNKAAREVFQTLLQFVMDCILESVSSRESIPIGEFLRYKRVFTVLICEDHRLGRVAGALANRFDQELHWLVDAETLGRPDEEGQNPLRRNVFSAKKHISKNLIEKSKKKGKLRVPSKIKARFKLYLVLSWVFETRKQDLLVFFIDKLALSWNQRFYANFVGQLLHEGRFQVERFAETLEWVLAAYEEVFQTEQEAVNSFKMDLSRDSRVQIIKHFQMRATMSLPKARKHYFRVKIDRMNLFLRKIELVCLLRNLAEVFAKRVTLANAGPVRVVARVFGLHPQYKIRETVRLFFLSVLDSEFGILSRFEPNVQSLFPELGKLTIDALSLVGPESLKELQRVERLLADEDRTKEHKFAYVGRPNRFYLLLVAVLNRAIVRALDSGTGLGQTTLLDSLISDVIGQFEEFHPLRYQLLRALEMSPGSPSALSLVTQTGSLNLKHKILIFNILIWTVCSEDSHPLFGLLLDMMNGNTETRKFFFNVHLPSGARNRGFVTDEYVYHEPSRDSLNLLKGEWQSRMWHLIMHGFLIGVIEARLINENIILEPLTRHTPQPRDYLVQHFTTSLAVLSKLCPETDLPVVLPVLFFRFSQSPQRAHAFRKSPENVSSRAEAMSFANKFNEKFVEFQKKPEKLIESCKTVFETLAKNKSRVDTGTRQLLERTLPEIEQLKYRREIGEHFLKTFGRIEPFLYSNLRKTKWSTDSNLLQELARADSRGRRRNANLAFILKNLVGGRCNRSTGWPGTSTGRSSSLRRFSETCNASGTKST